MCGRYTISNRIEALAERFHATVALEFLTHDWTTETWGQMIQHPADRAWRSARS